MHKLITLFISILLFSQHAMAQSNTDAPSQASYSIVIVNTEKEFQKAMSSFLKEAKKKPGSKGAKKSEELFYPLLFTDPRYKIFGDREPPYWMMPLESADKMTLTQARLQPSGILEMWFHIRLPEKLAYPFVLEFHKMAGTTLHFTPDAPNSTTAHITVPVEAKDGFKQEYNASGTLLVTIPLSIIADASPPRNKALRKFLK